MASLVPLRRRRRLLLGLLVYLFVSIHHWTMVRAQFTTSLLPVSQLDHVQATNKTGINKETPDSSTTRILHYKFCQQPVVPCPQELQHDHAPTKQNPAPTRRPLPPPPPPLKHIKGQPKPILFYHQPKPTIMEGDLFATQYSSHTAATHNKGKKSSRSSSKKKKSVKGRKPVPTYNHHHYAAWFDSKPKDVVVDDKNNNARSGKKSTKKKWVAVPPGKGAYYHTHHGGGSRGKTVVRRKPAKGKGGKGRHHHDIFAPPPTSSSPTTPGTFTMLALPVTGREPGDQLGRGVAVSSRFGNFMAIGSPNANDSNGMVQVYQLKPQSNSNSSSASSSVWVQVGQDIEGPAGSSSSLTGFALDLSDDGTVLMVGDLGVYNQTGQVRILAYNEIENEWVQRGEAIRGERAGDIFGAAVSMSSTGDIIAVGAPGFSTSSNSSTSEDAENVGQVRAFRWNAATLQWDAFGRALVGDAAGDLAGFSVSLSADGQTLAYGLPTHDVVVDSGSSVEQVRVVDAGQVRIVKMDSSNSNNIFSSGSGGGDWISRGDAIHGTMDGAEAGWDVELSGDGNRIIVGMPGTTVPINGVATQDAGTIRVYQYQKEDDTVSSSSWVQLGQEFLGNGQYYKDNGGGGETPGSRLGQSVAMSSDGTTIAFFAGPVFVDSSSGGVVADAVGGRVPVHVYDDNEHQDAAVWIQRDTEIIVEDTIGPIPYALSLSANGSIVMVGAIGLDDVGTSTGYRSSSSRSSLSTRM